MAGSTAIEANVVDAARALLAFLAMLLAPAIAAPAFAHESLPIVVTLDEQTAGEFALGVRLPGNVEPIQSPVPSIGPPCAARAVGTTSSLHSCPRGFRPDAVRLEWPGGVPASAILFRAAFRDGGQTSDVSQPGARSLDLPREETPWRVTGSYIRIGVEHILFGMDHLLFLACLVLLARTARRIALTISGFTLGHAVTISLASLGLIRVDGLVVEALVALSIVFVASELVRQRKDTLIFRHPVLVTVGFGTLHGLGFAGTLSEIGLAQSSIALSLIGFNLGVEAGQFIFVLLVFALMALGRRLALGNASTFVEQIRSAALAVIGIAASFWFWERGLALFV